jgi:hypothetical protein
MRGPVTIGKSHLTSLTTVLRNKNGKFLPIQRFHSIIESKEIDIRQKRKYKKTIMYHQAAKTCVQLTSLLLLPSQWKKNQEPAKDFKRFLISGKKMVYLNKPSLSALRLYHVYLSMRERLNVYFIPKSRRRRRIYKVQAPTSRKIFLAI